MAVVAQVEVVAAVSHKVVTGKVMQAVISNLRQIGDSRQLPLQLATERNLHGVINKLGLSKVIHSSKEGGVRYVRNFSCMCLCIILRIAIVYIPNVDCIQNLIEWFCNLVNGFVIFQAVVSWIWAATRPACSANTCWPMDS